MTQPRPLRTCWKHRAFGTSSARLLQERTPRHVVSAILSNVAGIDGSVVPEPVEDLMRTEAEAPSDTPFFDDLTDSFGCAAEDVLPVPPRHGGGRRTAGYRAPVACAVAGITFRQLDYWAKSELVVPSAVTGRGHLRRLYSPDDIVLLKLTKRLLDTGVSLPNIRVVVQHLRELSHENLAGLIFMSDGESVYECRTGDDLVDLMQHGAAIFGISVARLVGEVGALLATKAAGGVLPEPVRQSALLNSD